MFSKKDYWERRNGGKRGQGEAEVPSKLAKDEQGKDRVSDVTIIAVKGRRLAISRAERRNMGIKTKRV